jgi:dTDP-4-dehydrorhamnose 3,5-epimerase
VSALQVEHWELPGCRLVSGPLFEDGRGRFRKPYQRSAFADEGLPVDFSEQYFSTSRRGVVRGMHLQLPPSEHWKMVVCLAGAVYDVALDLRKRSAAYGRHAGIALSADTPMAVVLPPGVAHGFVAVAEDALVGYWLTSEHDAERDTGVRWDSFGASWPLPGEPVVSDRDAALPRLQDFESPFDEEVTA